MKKATEPLYPIGTQVTFYDDFSYNPQCFALRTTTVISITQVYKMLLGPDAKLDSHFRYELAGVNRVQISEIELKQ